MVHILETLQRLENKFDNLSVSPNTTPSSSRQYQASSESAQTSSTHAQQQPQSETDRPDESYAVEPALAKELQRSYQHLTAAHKIILWPSIYLYITSTNLEVAEDLQYVLQDGTPWLIHLELFKHPKPLPGPPNVHSIVASSTRQNLTANTSFAGLSIETIQRLLDAYFNTFNVIHPLLDHDIFVSDVVGPLIRHGYEDGDPRACLCLLVLALGQVAIDGVYGSPVTTLSTGQPSGLRGGSNYRPPGLEIFNEARRLTGFSMNQCSLENVQIYLLQAYNLASPHPNCRR